MGDSFLTFEQRLRLREAVSDAVKRRVGPVGSGVRKGRHQRTSFDLSPRELEVLTLASGGMTKPDIARLLSIAEQTVKDHLAHARQKLGAKNTTHAVLLASQQGILKEAA